MCRLPLRSRRHTPRKSNIFQRSYWTTFTPPQWLPFTPPLTVPQFGQYAVIPPPDAIQEFQVLTSNMPAEFGRTGGGVINVSMRNGTNGFHGAAYEFFRNSALDANDWFNDHTGQPKGQYTRNDFGFNLGGPIRKNHTFFFANYEGIRQRQAFAGVFTVPTLLQRQGDFSQTFAQNGQLQTIYNPYSTHTVPSGYARDPFQGNQITPSLLNPISLALLKYWPQPNLPGDPITHANNFISHASGGFDTNQINIRVDQQFGSSDHLFARFSRNQSTQTPPNIYNNIATPSSGPHTFTQYNAALNEAHIFGPHTFGTLRAGLTRLHDNSGIFGKGFDPTSVGFPSLDQTPANLAMPSMNVAGYVVSSPGFGAGSLGPVVNAILNNFSDQYTFQGDVTRTWGNHIVKTGLDFRIIRNDGMRPFLPSFAFTPGYTQGPNPTIGSATDGNAFASFLLGIPGSGNVQRDPTQDTQSHYFAGFLQDDYKATRKLTLNLGFRIESETFRTDRHNRLTNIDFTSPSPLKVPGLPPLKGGVTFVGVNGRSRQQASTPIAFEPRVGFAYALNSNTVLRGSYGIVSPPRALGGQFAQIGFQSITTYITSYNGVTPVSSWTDSYPNGFNTPTGSSLGLLTNVGGPITSVDFNQKLIYIQQWNASVQRSLGWNTVINVNYIGSKGTHLLRNQEFNQLPNSALALGQGLLNSVTNPFRGQVPASQPLGGPSIQAGQLLRPYPQFSDFSVIGYTGGSSSYNALAIQLEKRLSGGLQFITSYTFSKLIDDLDDPGPNFLGGNSANQVYQDNNNLQLERSVNAQQGPQIFSVATTYHLPVGRGQKFMSDPPRVVSAVVSGWEVNAIGRILSGLPLTMSATNNSHSFGGGERPNFTGQHLHQSGSVEKRLDEYFNVAAFSQPAPYTFGDVPRTLPTLRGPGLKTLDVSADKTFHIVDQLNLQFRAEAFNALNNPNFGIPNTTLGSQTFGVITSANPMRIMQFALKLQF